MSARRRLDELARILKQAREQVQQREPQIHIVFVPAEQFDAAFIAVAALPPDHPRFFLAPEPEETDSAYG